MKNNPMQSIDAAVAIIRFLAALRAALSRFER
jgi:hypothetical protein